MHSGTLWVPNKKTTLTVILSFYVAVLILLYACPLTQAQTPISFTPADKFTIPEKNGSISFLYNGTYSSATLKNDVWIFTDLTLNGSSPLGNLTIGAENSHVNVWAYRALNTSFRSALVRYSVEGAGKQTVNLGLNLSRPSHWSQWSVIVPNSVFLPKGEVWDLLPDDTVVVKGLEGNVSVVRYSFRMPYDDDLPFYLRHSVALVTAAVLAGVVSAALIVKFKGRRGRADGL